MSIGHHGYVLNEFQKGRHDALTVGPLKNVQGVQPTAYLNGFNEGIQTLRASLDINVLSFIDFLFYAWENAMLLNVTLQTGPINSFSRRSVHVLLGVMVKSKLVRIALCDDKTSLVISCNLTSAVELS